MPAAYYNENDPFAAEWLRRLISAGNVASGEVDERSIADVHPDDLRSFTQCHFFAGIGVWSYALQLAGWPDDRPVWTGSCPCQPFSGAGKRRGREDERHLWPVWFDLIRECCPATIFGEQVASRDALDWLDHVQTDLESTGYAFGTADLCVAGVGGPHWRQRLWFVANADGRNAGTEGLQRSGKHGQQPQDCGTGDMANASGAGLPSCKRRELPSQDRDDQGRTAKQRGGASGGLADAERGQFSQQIGLPQGRDGQRSDRESAGDDTGRPGPVNGFWADADWLRCTDGKWRAVEPGTQPLAHGIAGRVGQLRAYGNCISPWPAKAFIEAASAAIADAG